jgi:hypothetical protein
LPLFPKGLLEKAEMTAEKNRSLSFSEKPLKANVFFFGFIH